PCTPAGQGRAGKPRATSGGRDGTLLFSRPCGYARPRLWIQSPIRRPWCRFRLTGGREVVGGWGQQVAPIRALLHLGLELWRKQILAFPDLPAASQRAVGPDQARGNGAQGAGQAVLLGQESLLSRQHRREVPHAFPVLEDGEANGGLGGGDALGQEIGSVLGA